MKRVTRNLLPVVAALTGLALAPAVSRAEEAAQPLASEAEAGSAADQPTTPPNPVEPGVPTTPTPEMPGGAEGAPKEAEPAEPFTPFLQVLTDKFPSAKPAKFPVGMMVLVDNSFGTGAFMLNSYARQPYVNTMVRLEPSLTIWKSLKARMRLDLNKEWISSYTQSTTVPNQLMITDLWMGVSMGEIYREKWTGIGFGAGVWTFAPTSIQSRGETLITAVRPFA
ncbi:MAG: hypothetical protein AB2A00_32295, partial [Myxococcota bacterium]